MDRRDATPDTVEELQDDVVTFSETLQLSIL
jgi:hypothetical protein